MPRAGLSADRLAAAGADLADERGFDQVTLSAVARLFDVTVASLYSHVANSHELTSRIAAIALAEMADHAAEAVAGRAGRDALVAFANAYRDYGRDHPGRFAATKYRLDPADAAASAGPRHAELMRTVLRGYDVPEPDATHAVRLLGSTIRGFVDLEAGGGFAHSEPDAETSWRRTLDALDMVLRSWSAQPRRGRP